MPVCIPELEWHPCAAPGTRVLASLLGLSHTQPIQSWNENTCWTGFYLLFFRQRATSNSSNCSPIRDGEAPVLQTLARRHCADKTKIWPG